MPDSIRYNPPPIGGGDYIWLMQYFKKRMRLENLFPFMPILPVACLVTSRENKKSSYGSIILYQRISTVDMMRLSINHLDRTLGE